MYLTEDGDRTNIIETSVGIYLKMAIKAVSETSVYMRTEAEHTLSISEVYIAFCLAMDVHP